ncbi:MAG: M20/M25/M40 family metallo-hydrolase [Thermoanaerobaculia bacterium]|jgi:acetylornithine deacetylase/succinyl-diaminopimelate desuccinylase-like protein
MRSTALALCVGAALSAAALPARAVLPPGVDDAAIAAAAVASFPEYLELLALPNDSIKAEDVRKNAVWLEAAFGRRGFATRLLENGGRPLVFAEYGRARGKEETVLFYLHFDGQPVVPSQWAQKDPFQPVVKRRGADGKWSEVDRGELARRDFDPDLRVFARSSSDDKGPIAMFLAVFDLLRARKIDPAVHVKVLLDSEEEVNSPGMAAAVAANAALLSTGAVVLVDGPSHASGRPTIVFGNRGLVTATLTVYGPRGPLHSGHFGNWVPNPAMRLAQLLASMKDDGGRATIPGWYARTALTEADRKVLADVPDDEAALKNRTGIAQPEKVGATYQESLQYPSLNVRGLASASVGDKAANVVPRDAVAELDLRTTVESDPAYLLDLMKKHVEAQGWHLVEKDPTDEERARWPKLARLSPHLPAEAARQPIDSPVGRWASSAIAGAWPATPLVRIRMMGGTLPTHEIVGPLKAPFVLVSVVNADNNQHAYDENLRIGNYLSGMRTLVALLTAPYPE